MQVQGQQDRAGGLGSAGYKDSYDNPPLKRQRMSIDLARRPGYDQEQQLSQRAFTQARDTFGSLTPRDSQAIHRGSFYSQGPPSASGSVAPDYTFGHQRTSSSSTSSPFVSPHHEYPSYPFSTPSNSLYQQPNRDQSFQYPQNQYSDIQSRQIPQLAQPIPPYRPVPSSLSSQIEQPKSYSRSYESEGYAPTDRGYASNHPTPRQDTYTSQPPSTLYDRPLQPLGRTLPDPTQTLPSVLPPLQSSFSSSQSRRDPLQSYPSGGNSSAEGGSQLHLSAQPNQEGQSYLPNLYRDPQNG